MWYVYVYLLMWHIKDDKLIEQNHKVVKEGFSERKEPIKVRETYRKRRNIIEKQSHIAVRGERSAQNRYRVQRSYGENYIGKFKEQQRKGSQPGRAEMRSASYQQEPHHTGLGQDFILSIIGARAAK